MGKEDIFDFLIEKPISILIAVFIGVVGVKILIELSKTPAISKNSTTYNITTQQAGFLSSFIGFVTDPTIDIIIFILILLIYIFYRNP